KKLSLPKPIPAQVPEDSILESTQACYFMEDFFSLLDYLEKNHVSFTLHNAFPRNDLKKIKKSFHFQDNGEEDGSNRIYPIKNTYFFFVFELAKIQNCIQCSPERIMKTASSEKIANSSLLNSIQDLYQIWLKGDFWNELTRIPQLIVQDRYYSYDSITFEYFPNARAIILQAIKQCNTQKWISMEFLCEEIRKEFPDFLFGKDLSKCTEFSYERPEKKYETRIYLNITERIPNSYFGAKLVWGKDWNKVEGRFIENVLAEPLHWFGMVNLSKKKDGTLLAFQLTDFGASLLGIEKEKKPPCLVIQPNFEILVYAEEASSETLWFITEIAEAISKQKVFQYKISRNSFCKARQKGYTCEKILSFLQENSKSNIPQNVAYTLKEWEEQQEKIKFFYDAVVLELESEELAQSLMEQKNFQDNIIQTLSPVFFQIKTKGLSEIQEWLKKKKKQIAECKYTGVQPDSIILGKEQKILLPDPASKPYQEYKIRQFAELIEETKEYQLYRLTREFTVGKIPIPKLMKWVREHSVEVVPAEFSLTVSHWSYPPTKLGLQKTMVISDRNNVLSQLLSHLPYLKNLIYYMPGSYFALVQEENLNIVQQELAKFNIQLDTDSFPHFFTIIPVLDSKENIPSLLQRYKNQRKIKNNGFPFGL
ncbi:MAG: helicase-associated domain-containing protein, partial [Candidatus Brocadiae bacterium]|nr:helicase-associated domain-containing protein [Candidatus Brocadiia bacterium]